MKRIFFVLFICFILFSCKTNSLPTEKSIYSDNFIEEINLPIKDNLLEVPIFSVDDWYTWSRESGKISSSVKQIDENKIFEFHNDSDLDYSIGISRQIPITKDTNFVITANAFVSEGELSPCFVTRDSSGNVIDWVSGITTIKEGNGYQAVTAFICVDSSKVATVEPRFIGYNRSKAKIINAKVQEFSMNNLETIKTIQNDSLKVECFTPTASFTITDKRNNKIYSQVQEPLPSIIILDSSSLSTENQIVLIGYSAIDKTNVYFSATLNETSVEYDFTTSKNDSENPFTQNDQISSLFSQNVCFPQKTICSSQDYLVIPMNEGIRFDAEDDSMPIMDLVAFSGHGISMPFYGITNGNAGFITIIETPDDAGLRLGRDNFSNRNCAGIAWYSQKGLFGYKRKATQTFLENGGHTSIALTYRDYAKKTGRLVTFEEKKKESPERAKNIDKLLGAANIWCWNNDSIVIANRLEEAGIDKILWSAGTSAKQIEELTKRNILVSRYDIYQDVMNPENYDKIAYKHSDWVPESFPHDITIGPDGNFVDAWPIERKDGNGFINCVALCDIQAPLYARKRIGEELKTHNYTSRFLDTVTASSLRECYSPNHPSTRTQSKLARYELLSIISKENSLVCGSETGWDYFVPVCDYFEGMLSLGPYRCDDSGRNMEQIIENPPAQITKVQVNEFYRLPLWELVYHDCCVAMWYWGDYNNKMPSVWKKRDLFNALYAVPPMYMFTLTSLGRNIDAFAQSYKISSDIVKATAGIAMTNHEYLTQDRTVQKTTFANGIEVIVNFGKKDFVYQNKTIPAETAKMNF
ncbi:MAG: hypothetical protein J6R03_05090 [Treponema sp.]|nr:hypothetical protein [Treponema sp.]